jgi:hypothetical protein
MLLVAILFTSAIQAQGKPINQGSWNAFGGFSYTNYKDREYTVFTIDPSFSYFATPGLSIGLSVLFRSESNGTKYSSLGFGPSIEYYIDPYNSRTRIEGSVYPFMGLAVLLMEESYESPGSNNDFSSTAVAIELGLLTMVARNAGLRMGITHISQKFEDSESESIVSFSGGFSYFIFD